MRGTQNKYDVVEVVETIDRSSEVRGKRGFVVKPNMVINSTMALDCVALKIIGLNWRKMPLLGNAFDCEMGWPLDGFEDSIVVKWIRMSI